MYGRQESNGNWEVLDYAYAAKSLSSKTWVADYQKCKHKRRTKATTPD